MRLNRATRRWLKRLGNIAIGALIVANVILCSLIPKNINYNVQNEDKKIVEIKETYNIDKINDVLKKNNLEVLDIKFNGSYSKTIVDQPKYKLFGDTFTEFRKKVANKTLDLTAEFNAIYKYDLSKLNATRIGDVTVIELKDEDLEIDVQYKNVKSKASYAILANYFTPQQITDIEAEMLQTAKNDITCKSNYREQALNNTKQDMLDLFNKCDINTNDILIKIL